MEKLGRRILAAVKNELYFDMPYLAYPLGSLQEVMDYSIPTMGTDGRAVRFRASYVFESYMERPGRLNRVYMHSLLHNLLMHPFDAASSLQRLAEGREGGLRHGENTGSSYENEAEDYPWEDYLRDLWGLSCDIAVESIVDSMDVSALRMVESDFRNQWYELLRSQVRTFSAERLFVYFLEHPPEGETLVRLEREFVRDDHRFWQWDADAPQEDWPDENIRYTPMADLPLKEVWEKAAKAIMAEVEQSGSERTLESGRLSWSLALCHQKRRDYRRLLEKYMIRREVAEVDPDAFDPAYYHYGMERYGNMPLIEELEGREVRRLETMVIAIDTSASTRREQVGRFVEETVSMLRREEDFFRRVHIHIIECDDRVQKDIEIQRIEEIEQYGTVFEAVGGYGTDYRPVFRKVTDLRREGRLPRMKALLYFTDGYGEYPTRSTDFDTVFVFAKGCDYDDTKVPKWALKAYV